MVLAFRAKGPRVELEQLIKLRHLAAGIELFPVCRSHSQQSGAYRSRFRGRGMDFEEVRLYQPGDDIRSIDWRVTARTARPHTKIFREEKDRPVLLAIDQSTSLFFGSQVTYKSVLAAELAALIAWAGLQQNDKVGGIVFNNKSYAEVRPLRNKHAVLKLLESISEFNHALFCMEPTLAPDEKKTDPDIVSMDFSQMLEHLRHIARPGTAIFLISDFMSYDLNAERLLHLIKRHNDVYALIVADRLEKKLPQDGIFSVTDGQNKLRFNSGDRQLANNYSQVFENRMQALESSFKKLQVNHKLVWTHDDPYKTILHLMGSRG